MFRASSADGMDNNIKLLVNSFAKKTPLDTYTSHTPDIVHQHELVPDEAALITDPCARMNVAKGFFVSFPTNMISRFFLCYPRKKN